jgi:hypothetical protein
VFADDIVFVGEILEEMNNRLDEWRLALDGKGLNHDNKRLCGKRSQEL